VLKVAHSGGSYPIEFVPIDEVRDRLPKNAFVVTDENVARLYGERFSDLPSLSLPPGEGSKGIETYARVMGWLADNGATRSATIVALGGGVVGDLVGFVAATYMRGVPCLQVPTTLLAQVDSSVGGKVAIDLPQGKNLAGSFAPPAQVLVPIETLSTLPEREFRAGMAEVCKYGFIMDRPMVEQLTERQADPSDMGPIVERCIRHKAYVVENDEFETTGLRAILNYGHTVGHAIEQVTGYGPVLHGEAIAVGMRVEAKLAESLDLAVPGTEAAVVECLERQGLRTRLGLHLEAEPLLSAMRRDKKRTGNGLPFSLVTELGRCKLFTGIAESDVAPLLNDL
jgi:3-dehydroquinate synthase